VVSINPIIQSIPRLESHTPKSWQYISDFKRKITNAGSNRSTDETLNIWIPASRTQRPVVPIFLYLCWHSLHFNCDIFLNDGPTISRYTMDYFLFTVYFQQMALNFTHSTLDLRFSRQWARGMRSSVLYSAPNYTAMLQPSRPNSF
jgi:hypothetical protein